MHTATEIHARTHTLSFNLSLSLSLSASLLNAQGMVGMLLPSPLFSALLAGVQTKQVLHSLAAVAAHGTASLPVLQWNTRVVVLLSSQPQVPVWWRRWPLFSCALLGPP